MYKLVWEALLGFGVTGIMRMDITYQCVSVGFSNSFVLKGRLDPWKRSDLVKVLKGRRVGKKIPGDTQNCSKSLRKGLPGCAHFIRPNVYMGKKGAVSCIVINMKPSRVYPLINYLVTLRETTPEGRKTMLYNKLDVN